MGMFGRMVVGVLPIMPRFLVGWVAKRYVAGINIDSAVSTMLELGEKEGCCFTVDVLGEEISSLEEAEFFLQEYGRVIDAIVEHKLDANISIKPTAFGLLIDQDTSYKNIEQLLTKAAKHDIFVRFDMEDHRVTQSTIDMVLKMYQQGLTNIGIVLQARLHRTLDDIQTICDALGVGADFRICKGIYLESYDIANTEYQQINKAFSGALTLMLENGSYCGIATHDKPLVKDALIQLRNMDMLPDTPDPRQNAGPSRKKKGPGYEFQMLLGVRGELRRRLLKGGHKVRVYIPFGEKWYEYSSRRLRENPDIAWHVTKALFMPWSNRR